MKSNWKIKTGIFYLLFSSATYAFTTEPPLTADEISSTKAYLFDNITTAKHVISKNDKGKIIRSIPGSVLASPSNKGPRFSQDYQFHWVRDAAITMHEVINLYAHTSGEEKNKLKSYLINYINFEDKIQQQPVALGEPKYNINATPWLDEWVRPQNDGPALRASSMIAIANILIAQKDEKKLQEKLLAMISKDLDYTVAEWQKPTGDLWEEIRDEDHFFTKIVERRALLEGAQLFRAEGDDARANLYEATAKQLTFSLQKHWNAGLGYYSETIHQQYFKGGGLDTSILLGVIYGQLPDANDPFAVNDDKVMSSIYFIRNAFTKLYKVNLENATPPMLGRYPNDIYDGDQFLYGNPWILTTNALAQYYYMLAERYLKLQSINITQDNILFFTGINNDLVKNTGIISRSSHPAEFNAIIDALVNEGDAILHHVKQYATCYPDRTCFHFSEQIDRASGEQVSAKDLTWGYTTLLNALDARTQLNSLSFKQS